MSKVHKLEELEVREVSIVDRPANTRKFLVVKDENGAEKGAEILLDEEGNLVTKSVDEVPQKVEDEASISEKSEKSEDVEEDKVPEIKSYESSDKFVKALNLLGEALKNLSPALSDDKTEQLEKSESVEEDNSNIEKHYEELTQRLDVLIKSLNKPNKKQPKKLASSNTLVVEKSEDKIEKEFWPLDLNA